MSVPTDAVGNPLQKELPEDIDWGSDGNEEETEQKPHKSVRGKAISGRTWKPIKQK